MDNVISWADYAEAMNCVHSKRIYLRVSSTNNQPPGENCEKIYSQVYNLDDNLVHEPTRNI